jgi:hypothetical protein
LLGRVRVRVRFRVTNLRNATGRSKLSWGEREMGRGLPNNGPKGGKREREREREGETE